MEADEWIYILSNPTTVNILCQRTNDAEETLQRIGTLHVDEHCKIYTDTTILEAETTIGISNITDKIPSPHIADDDCCVRLRDNITLAHVRLQPIKMSNLDLDELKYSKQKLSEIDA